MNHASLFSGIGGAEVAASMMGWQNLFHCEIQEFPRKVLQYWFPNSESYEDITKTDFTKWHGKVDVLTGGFPCQPFSLAGRRKGADHKGLRQCLGATSGLRDIPCHRGRRRKQQTIKNIQLWNRKILIFMRF